MASGAKILKLKKPLTDGSGKAITELKITEPTAEHLINFGFPVTPDGKPDVKAAFNILEAVTGVQLPYLRQMGWADTLNAIAEITSYLGVDEEAAKN